MRAQGIMTRTMQAVRSSGSNGCDETVGIIAQADAALA